MGTSPQTRSLLAAHQTLLPRPRRCRSALACSGSEAHAVAAIGRYSAQQPPFQALMACPSAAPTIQRRPELLCAEPSYAPTRTFKSPAHSSNSFRQGSLGVNDNPLKWIRGLVKQRMQSGPYRGHGPLRGAIVRDRREPRPVSHHARAGEAFQVGQAGHTSGDKRVRNYPDRSRETEYLAGPELQRESWRARTRPFRVPDESARVMQRYDDWNERAEFSSTDNYDLLDHRGARDYHVTSRSSAAVPLCGPSVGRHDESHTPTGILGGGRIRRYPYQARAHENARHYDAETSRGSSQAWDGGFSRDQMRYMHPDEALSARTEYHTEYRPGYHPEYRPEYHESETADRESNGNARAFVSGVLPGYENAYGPFTHATRRSHGTGMWVPGEHDVDAEFFEQRAEREMHSSGQRFREPMPYSHAPEPFDDPLESGRPGTATPERVSEGEYAVRAGQSSRSHTFADDIPPSYIPTQQRVEADQIGTQTLLDVMKMVDKIMGYLTLIQGSAVRDTGFPVKMRITDLFRALFREMESEAKLACARCKGLVRVTNLPDGSHEVVGLRRQRSCHFHEGINIAFTRLILSDTGAVEKYPDEAFSCCGQSELWKCAERESCSIGARRCLRCGFVDEFGSTDGPCVVHMAVESFVIEDEQSLRGGRWGCCGKPDLQAAGCFTYRTHDFEGPFVAEPRFVPRSWKGIVELWKKHVEVALLKSRRLMDVLHPSISRVLFALADVRHALVDMSIRNKKLLCTTCGKSMLALEPCT
ncbi:hypothetical protein FVE85_7873 [Porphyridium purpureum]|uniref:Uncharacterized protein n=1 Tax=Porphyridium purpureum TaxID=35688 RepID=A0A5J4YLR2_PORPP|nr:hypothetical protein FVE85_7873 [Porphyridium purpureum]|eukprot:POR5603..scf295_9